LTNTGGLDSVTFEVRRTWPLAPEKQRPVLFGEFSACTCDTLLSRGPLGIILSSLDFLCDFAYLVQLKNRHPLDKAERLDHMSADESEHITDNNSVADNRLNGRDQIWHCQ